MSRHTQFQNNKYTVLIPNAVVKTAGTVDTATFVPVTGFESHAVLFNIGTVNAGSIAQLAVLLASGTSGAGTVVVTGGSLATGDITGGTTSGLWGIEFKTNALYGGTAPFNGTVYIGARIVTNTGGSVFASAI